MTIHFIYAGSPDMGAINAPYVITNVLYYFLKSKAPITYHDWTEKIDLNIEPNDIIIGHPNYDQNTVVQRAFKNSTCKAKCLIHPLHTNRVNDNLPFNHLAKQADHIFSICGPYWYDTLDKTPFAHWKPKITRLDLAINPQSYPHIKKTFNPPGSRRLVYIGSDSPNKNLQYLTKIMTTLKDVTLHWYGGNRDNPLAKLPNVYTEGWTILNEQRAREICHWCDIMVSTSDSDANPTTLLETTAWGLIGACTKESGYYNTPMFAELHLDDFTKTINTLRHILQQPNHELELKSQQNRRTIERQYTWDIFCNKIWQVIEKYVT